MEWRFTPDDTVLPIRGQYLPNGQEELKCLINLPLYLYKRRKFFNRNRGNEVDGPGGGRSHGCVWSRGLSCCRPSLSEEREGVLPGRGGQGGGTGVFLQSGGEESQVREEIVLRA